MGTIKIQCYKYHYKKWLPNGFIVEKEETTIKPKTNDKIQNSRKER